jgi:hypothetical protein
MFKRALVIAVLASAVFAGAAPARVSEASWHPFLVHVNSDRPRPTNCGAADWWSTAAYCYGSSAPSGHSYGFNLTTVDVSWCVPSGWCPMAAGHTLPHGWTRWMKVCAPVGNGECIDNWLLGAVVMPNGPFAIVAGKINGHHVTPTSFDQSRIGKQGGPLALIVTYTGSVSNGGGVAASNGYTFGFVGHVHF